MAGSRSLGTKALRQVYCYLLFAATTTQAANANGGNGGDGIGKVITTLLPAAEITTSRSAAVMNCLLLVMMTAVPVAIFCCLGNARH